MLNFCDFILVYVFTTNHHLNVKLAGGHLYGKQLFTWLSLMVSLMAFLVLSFFPLDVLDEIWDVIDSVSEGFLTCFCKMTSTLKGMNLLRWGQILSFMK